MMPDADRFYAETRIGEAVSESIADRNVKCIEITVSDKDTLFVLLPGKVAVVVREGVRTRIILVLHRPGVREFSGRRGGAGNDVSNRVAGFHAGLMNIENRLDVRVFLRKAKIDEAAGVEDEDDSGIEFIQSGDEGILLLRQLVVSLFIEAVRAFAGISCDDIHRDIRHLLLREHLYRLYELRIAVDVPELHHVVSVLAKFLPDFLAPCDMSVIEFLFIILKPVAVRDRVSGILQSLPDVHGLARVDIARAGAALDRVVGALAVQRDARALCNRKDIVLILQKDHALRCCPARDLPVFCFKRLYLVGRKAAQFPFPDFLHKYPP